MSRTAEYLEGLEDTQREHKSLLQAHIALLAEAALAKVNEPGRYDDYYNGLMDAASDLEHVGNQIAEELGHATPTETYRHPDTGEVLAVLS